jgi:hypothetical protein
MENLEWVEMFFDEKYKNNEEIGRIDEYEMEWNLENKEANIFGPNGNLLVRAKFKDGMENGEENNRRGQNEWNKNEQKRGKGFGQKDNELKKVRRMGNIIFMNAKKLSNLVSPRKVE